MLELGGVLRTWAMEALPIAGESTAAEQLQDHRLAYLEYEGEISGERGSVSRVDAGEYEIDEETELAITARMTGQRLKGTLTLVRDERESQRWRVSFSPGWPAVMGRG